MSEQPAPIALVGGVVAYNEEATIGAALRSLIDQDLGGRAQWRTVWVVASGCTDRTVERVRAIAADDPRVVIVEQPERRGKADALNELFSRAHGDLLVFLNGDAIAEPGAVRALVEAADGLTGPFAVMGHPVPPPTSANVLQGAIGLLWRVHATLHAQTLEHGEGNHLSDELILLSLPVVSRLTAGTINDGAYLGAVLARAGGELRYAPSARVRIQVPKDVSGYLAQRRRIYAGHARQSRELGMVPTTLLSLALRAPDRALRLLLGEWRTAPHRDRLPLLVALEAAAIMLAVWDELPPRRSHVRWRRVERLSGWQSRSERESSQI